MSPEAVSQPNEIKISGYKHPEYADSLREFGTPVELPACGGWILERPIDGFPYTDAMGCYPLFACRDWSKLHLDIVSLKDDLVSLAIVTDPFGEYDVEYLRQCFPDIVLPFKEHYLVDIASPKQKISSHHRYYVKKALRTMQVEVSNDPAQHLNDWHEMYSTLIRRHNLKGIKAFSRTAFAKQLNIPGMIMLRAIDEGEIVGAMLWFIQDGIGYSHLAAFSERGYQLSASYALYGYAIEYFADKVRCLDLGAGAGTVNDKADGLALFKRGWSTGTHTVYFCGRVLNRKKYNEINVTGGIQGINYFPKYRKGEFS